MQTQNIRTYGDYLDYLQVHPEEFATLFNKSALYTAFTPNHPSPIPNPSAVSNSTELLR